MTASLYVTKRDFRRMVWDQMEAGSLTVSQRPNYQRLPNFVGADEAARRIVEMSEFAECNTVVINPDQAQEPLRILALKAGKTVYVPTPQQRFGMFSQLMVPTADGEGADGKEDDADELLVQAARGAGQNRYSTQLTVEQLQPVDLFIVGAVAVSKQGYRIGQGDGHADMDYAVIRTAGAITDSTLVITAVHDEQVFDRLPCELFGAHDVSVDVIVTPTRVIHVQERLDKPPGIVWSLITPQKLKPLVVIRALRDKQMAAGVEVKLSDGYGDEGYDRRGPARGGGGRPPRYSRSRRGASESQPSLKAVNGGAIEEVGEPRSQEIGEQRPRRPPAVSGRRGGRRQNTAADRNANPKRQDDEAVVEQRDPPLRRQQEPKKRRPAAERLDDSELVVVRFLPLAARRADLREALRAVGAEAGCTVVSWLAGRRALVRVPSAEVRALLLQAEMQMCGRRVLVEEPVGRGAVQRPGCTVVVSGLSTGNRGFRVPQQLRQALYKMQMDQLLVHRRGDGLAVELLDEQAAGKLVAEQDQLRKLMCCESLTLRGCQASDAAAAVTDGEPVESKDEKVEAEESSVEPDTKIKQDSSVVDVKKSITEAEHSVCPEELKVNSDTEVTDAGVDAAKSPAEVKAQPVEVGVTLAKADEQKSKAEAKPAEPSTEGKDAMVDGNGASPEETLSGESKEKSAFVTAGCVLVKQLVESPEEAVVSVTPNQVETVDKPAQSSPVPSIEIDLVESCADAPTPVDEVTDSAPVQQSAASGASAVSEPVEPALEATVDGDRFEDAGDVSDAITAETEGSALDKNGAGDCVEFADAMESVDSVAEINCPLKKPPVCGNGVPPEADIAADVAEKQVEGAVDV